MHLQEVDFENMENIWSSILEVWATIAMECLINKKLYSKLWEFVIFSGYFIDWLQNIIFGWNDH